MLTLNDALLDLVEKRRSVRTRAYVKSVEEERAGGVTQGQGATSSRSRLDGPPTAKRNQAEPNAAQPRVRRSLPFPKNPDRANSSDIAASQPQVCLERAEVVGRHV